MWVRRDYSKLTRKDSSSTGLREIRRLVDQSGVPYPKLAEMAKVNYPNLRRFMLGITENLNFVEVEKLYLYLTGKPLTTPGVPLKREFRKKGGKAA